MSASHDLSKVTDRLGVDFDLRENTYKPFPCGIVNHPTIDGAIQIHDEHHLDPASIVAVRLRVAPLVLDLCNQQNITKACRESSRCTTAPPSGSYAARAVFASIPTMP
jgi:2-methylcitrate dehydratase PrpD